MIEGNFTVNYPGFSLSTGNFKIRENEITIIYGDSGSGKSTFLNCIAGIEKGYSGEISLKEESVIGYVFQRSSLFPHLNVRENLEYSYRRCIEPQYSFEEIVNLLSMRELLDKDIEDLSGGEIQRVSIGRSILSSPDILLMDEPLSALHSDAKSEIIQLILSIRKRIKIPILIVTHSRSELVSLCDSAIYIKRNSPIEQLSREEVLLRIDSRGPINFISNEMVKKLNLKIALNSFEGLIIHSANILVMKANFEGPIFSNHLRCFLSSVSDFDESFVILKLEYFENNFLYSKLSKENFKSLSISIGEGLVALFGPESHIV